MARDDSNEPVRSIHERASLVAMTPSGQNMFFGFHDVTPWSPDNSALLVHRLDPAWKEMRDSTGEAEICLWHPATGEIRTVGRTTAWNFQQGARAQWIPGSGGAFSYNRMSADGTLVAAIGHIDGRAERELPGGVYDIAAAGLWAVSPDFTILAHRWPAYGYASLAGEAENTNPQTNGLWRTDLVSGERRLLVSVADVQKSWSRTELKSEGDFLTHASISPDGERVLFMHRFFSPDGGLFTRLLCCDAQGGNLRSIAEEKVSHFDWLDNRRLLVWARFAGGGLAQARASGSLNKAWLRPLLNLARRYSGRWKKRLLSESYYAIDVDNPSDRPRYGWPKLDSDGHPMMPLSHDWLVTDTYPDATGTLPLILFRASDGQRIDIAGLADGVTVTDTDAKCDLHPRFDRTERLIAVDCCDVNGLRRMALFDVSGIVGADT